MPDEGYRPADDADDFVDAGRESALARWSSLAAPLLPSLLFSRETAATLFATPWRGVASPALRVRALALQIRAVFEHDLASQLSWLGCGWRACVASVQLSPGELLCWGYSFVVLLATLAGASAASSALGFGGLVRRLYVLGAAQSFITFVYDAMTIADVGLPRAGVTLLRAKAREFALAAAAAWLLPADVVATHLAACLIYGFCERAVACVLRLRRPLLDAMRSVRCRMLTLARYPLEDDGTITTPAATLRALSEANRVAQAVPSGSPPKCDSGDSDDEGCSGQESIACRRSYRGAA